MSRTLVPWLFLLAVVSAGCLDPTKSTVDPPLDYAQNLSDPDSLVRNLMVSYRQREAGPYANLLSADFQFRFLPEYFGEVSDGVWNRDEDVAATAALFGKIDEVYCDLSWEPGAPDSIRGEPVQRVDVTFTALHVDIDGGKNTLAVNGDRQEFFFLPGRQAMGEDPGRWYLFEWHDLGDPERRGAVKPSSWSEIKLLGVPSVGVFDGGFFGR